MRGQAFGASGPSLWTDVRCLRAITSTTIGPVPLQKRRTGAVTPRRSPHPCASGRPRCWPRPSPPIAAQSPSITTCVRDMDVVSCACETGVHRAEYKVPVPSTNPILFRNAFLGPCFLFRGPVPETGLKRAVAGAQSCAIERTPARHVGVLSRVFAES